MALTLAISTPFGIDLPTAYAKISSFGGNKDCFTFQVDYFATQAARDAGTPVVKSESYQFNTVDPQNIASLYTYLKTLPEFAGAVDC